MAGAASQRSDGLPMVVITAPPRWPTLGLAELWQYRELAVMLAMRDIRARYKQTALGVGWVLFQPLAVIGLFTVLFSLLLGQDRLPTAPGVPYALSTAVAWLPWNLFATTVAQSTSSLVDNRALITKVYFPRLIVPAAPVVGALVDFLIASLIIVLLIGWYGATAGYRFEASAALFALPLFAILALAFALAAALWLAALTAIYRDIRYIVPFATQLLLFATPVVYSSDTIAPRLSGTARLLFELNPMVGVVEGFRWALFGLEAPPMRAFALSALGVAVLLVGGAYYFRRMERSFADLV